MIHKPSLLAGAGAAIAVRALLPRVALLKLRSDVCRLNAGDHKPLLAGYADDCVPRTLKEDRCRRRYRRMRCCTQR